MNSSELNTTITNILRSEKIKTTLPRVLVLSILFEENRELTANEIEKIIFEKQNKNIYISTIYNVLKTLEKFNLIQKFKLGDQQAYYSIKNTPNTIRAYCDQCNQSFFIHDSILEEQIHSITANREIQLNSFSVILQVRCNNCKNNN